MKMYRRSFLMVLGLIGSALITSCGPRQAVPAPRITAEVIGNSPEVEGKDPGDIAPVEVDAVVDWWGVIRSTDAGAQYDDYFERQDLGQVIYFGIDSMDPAVRPQIEAMRDSGRIVHLYGRLISDVPDYGGAQIQVERIEVED